MNLSSIIFGATASLLWSTVFVVGRYLCDTLGIHPILVAFLRFNLAGLMVILYLIVMKRSSPLDILTKSPLYIVFLSLTGISSMGSAVFGALSYSTAVDVSIIMNSNAIFITPIAGITGERLTIKNALGTLVGLIGCAIVINGGTTSIGLLQREHLIGNLLALLAAVSWAVYTVAGKKIVREYGGLSVTGLNMLIGSLPLFIVTSATGELILPPLEAVLAILYLAIFPTAIGFVLWYKALEKIDAIRLGPLQYLVPIGTAIISTFTLREKITFASLIGMLLVFTGIYFSSISPDGSNQQRPLNNQR